MGSGTSYCVCIGDVVPSAEVCGDSLDNDCDGLVDEGCVGDQAWHDIDGDGVQDPREPAIAGATFILRAGTTGAVLAVTISDLSGSYYFSGVPPVTYFIEVIPPTGHVVTALDAGSDDSLDSNFDADTLTSEVFTLAVNDFDIDCGFTICGDGVVQPGEQCDDGNPTPSTAATSGHQPGLTDLPASDAAAGIARFRTAAMALLTRLPGSARRAEGHDPAACDRPGTRGRDPRPRRPTPT